MEAESECFYYLYLFRDLYWYIHRYVWYLMCVLYQVKWVPIFFSMIFSIIIYKGKSDITFLSIRGSMNSIPVKSRQQPKTCTRLPPKPPAIFSKLCCLFYIFFKGRDYNNFQVVLLILLNIKHPQFSP